METSVGVARPCQPTTTTNQQNQQKQIAGYKSSKTITIISLPQPYLLV